MRYDPSWTAAACDSVCSCGSKITTGDRVMYYPRMRANGDLSGIIVCEKCGVVEEETEETAEEIAFDVD
ncbi:hypothetical protein M0R72_14850 [Candidatus Pacearchaeota archaeon]|nr:hypothetical protein [Candidatus Pacearchaeota archaeon]